MEEIVTNVVIDSILNLENEQRKVLAYIHELESRQNQLLSFVDSVTEQILPDGEKAKLCKKILKMALVVGCAKSEEESHIKKHEKQKRCRHNNLGFCKMGTNCVYYHTDKVCEQHLTNGKCPEPKLCSFRHPKECKFWLGDIRGCFRGEECKYLHKMENKGKKVKDNEQKRHDNDPKVGKQDHQKKVVVKDFNNKQSDEKDINPKNVTIEKVVQEKIIISKEIKECSDCNGTSACVNNVHKDEGDLYEHEEESLESIMAKARAFEFDESFQD